MVTAGTVWRKHSFSFLSFSFFYSLISHTVELVNNGHIGIGHFVFYSQVVLSSEVKCVSIIEK